MKPFKNAGIGREKLRALLPVANKGLIALCLCISTSLAHGDQVLRLGRISSSPDQIISSEILEQVCRRLNVKIVFVDEPAQRCLLSGSSGQLDGLVARTIDVAGNHPSLIPIAPSINFIEPSVFSRKTSISTDDGALTRSYKTGSVRGLDYAESDSLRTYPLIMADSLDSLLKMLNANRIDLGVADLFSGMVRLRELGLGHEIHVVFPPLQRIELYHYLNERHKNLTPQVQWILRDMEASGELLSLQEKFRRRALNNALP
ncbi:MAG: transporter substrate-binding domain-containing protein [Pseudomonadota bacterium]